MLADSSIIATEHVLRVGSGADSAVLVSRAVEALDAGRPAVLLAAARRTGLLHRICDEISRLHPGVEFVAGRSGRGVRVYLWPATLTASPTWFYE